MFIFNKKEFGEDFNKLKEVTPSIVIFLLGVGALITLADFLLYWLPSYLSPEQCNEVPNIGSMPLMMLMIVTATFLVIFLTWLVCAVQYNTHLKRKKKKTPNYKNAEEWNEFHKKEDARILKRAKRRAVFMKWFPWIWQGAVLILVLGVLIYIALSNYYCW